MSDSFVSCLNLDSREELRRASVRLLASTLAFSALLIVPVAAAAYLRAVVGLVVAVSFALPLCSLGGVMWKSSSLLRAACCCTPVCVIVFIICASSTFLGEKVRVECICNADCAELPPSLSLGSLGRGNRGGGGGGGNGNLPQSQNLTVLRSQTLYENLCGNLPRTEATFTIYPLFGTLAFAFQFFSCFLANYISRTWIERGPGAGVLSSASQPQRLSVRAVRNGEFDFEADLPPVPAPAPVMLPAGMSMRTRGGLTLVGPPALVVLQQQLQQPVSPLQMQQESLPVGSGRRKFAPTAAEDSLVT